MSTFESFDGTRIAYELWGQDADGPPVVLHHGFAADRNLNWVRPGIVASLVEAGHRVVALDARSHGESDKPLDAARCGEVAMARDLAVLFDRLQTDEVHLVGYSMGAVVSLLCAAQDPRVTRLAVGGVGEGILACGGVDQRILPADKLRAGLLTDDPSTIAEPPAAGFRAFVDAIGADRRALAAHCAAVHASPIPLDSITAPTLVLAGREDPLAARPERLADAIAGATLTLVPGDHLGAVNTQELRTALLEFLA